MTTVMLIQTDEASAAPWEPRIGGIAYVEGKMRVKIVALDGEMASVAQGEAVSRVPAAWLTERAMP